MLRGEGLREVRRGKGRGLVNDVGRSDAESEHPSVYWFEMKRR